MNEDVLVEDVNESDEASKPVRRKPQVLPPIELLYRQVYDLIDSKLFGFESQIRINDRKLGTLEPSLFVPIAERSNQIVELGKWSFVEMSDMIRRQRAKGRVIPCMFMPVSVKYFCKKYFADNVMRQIEKAAMQPSEVCVVLPAGSLHDKTQGIREALDAVREKGIKVALSGVGADGVSLSHLSELAVDFLKLDATFVNQLLDNDRAMEIANSFSELATKLGAQLIAEGVDTKEHTVPLQAVGCSLMQGGYFGAFERESRMF